MEYEQRKGKLDARGRSFGVVVARFNELISRELLHGALDCLERHNAARVEVFWTPGTFEIPALARRLAQVGRFHAIICLGAVIRGDTPHFEYIAGQVARGVARVYYETGIPTIFGIITADTVDQAVERAGTKHGNKGWDAAISAIELCDLEAQLKEGAQA